jgi:hypothetical protein
MLLLAATVVANGQAEKTKEQKKQERKERISRLAKEEEEGTLVYSKQSAFGFKAATDGWGAFYEHGKYKTVTKTSLWWLEFGEHKNKKEDKQTFTDINGFQIGNSFIFGKINNFYNLKAGIGQQTLIGGKGNKNGVAVSAIYGGGISLGYLKPYYLTVPDNQGGTKDIKYTDSTADEFTNPAYIIGGAGFTKGWGEGKLVPGVHIKAALRFDYGRYNEVLSALEVGINAEYYTKDMRIMLGIPNKQFFVNSYIALVFGSRKNAK